MAKVNRKLDHLDDMYDVKSLAGTPEGRLFLAILLNALEELNKELIEGKPLYTLNWFKHHNEVLQMCYMILDTTREEFMEQLELKIKSGRIIPIDMPKPVTGRNKSAVHYNIGTLDKYLRMNRGK
jgi:hypothetical protein